MEVDLTLKQQQEDVQISAMKEEEVSINTKQEITNHQSQICTRSFPYHHLQSTSTTFDQQQREEEEDQPKIKKLRRSSSSHTPLLSSVYKPSVRPPSLTYRSSTMRSSSLSLQMRMSPNTRSSTTRSSPSSILLPPTQTTKKKKKMIRNHPSKDQNNPLIIPPTIEKKKRSKSGFRSLIDHLQVGTSKNNEDGLLDLNTIQSTTNIFAQTPPLNNKENRINILRPKNHHQNNPNRKKKGELIKRYSV